jgi:tetratricopeptide (TPR) repeat protein
MQHEKPQTDFNFADELRRGLLYHQSAQLEKAQEIYSQILKIDPLHPDALNLSGLLALEDGNLARAEMLRPG